MKRAMIAIVLVVLLCPRTNGQENVNVLSYYAVGNSLDGQPMIDMVNILRFYPVFAMRDSVDNVKITIYYGSSVFSRQAEKLDGGRYWQILLPKFNLGEAIQRMEVETHFNFSGSLAIRIRAAFNRTRGNLVMETNFDQQRGLVDQLMRIDENVKTYRETFDESKIGFKDLVMATDTELERLGQKGMGDKLRLLFDDSLLCYIQRDGPLFQNWGNMTKENQKTLDSLVILRSRALRDYRKKYETTRDTAKLFLEQAVDVKKRIEALRQSVSDDEKQNAPCLDSLKSELARDIEAGLSDSSYSGPAVRKADIVIDDSYRGARILYRNYKTSLRRMPALDPAEHMGIFRVRYVPFPIVGTATAPRMSLLKPMSASSPTVFEIGLAFGDAIVPGDEFVVPEFSWRRLGVAFAITEKLFSDSAEVIGLALTYDFNSYGSIGIGGNFAHNEAHGYASLGINKKAFEAVIKGIASIFQ